MAPRGSLSRTWAAASLAILLLGLAACEVFDDFGEYDHQTPEPIPSGAQQVHVTLQRTSAPASGMWS